MPLNTAHSFFKHISSCAEYVGICAFWENAAVLRWGTLKSCHRQQHQQVMLQCPSAGKLRERLADLDSWANKGRIPKVVLCLVQGMSMRLQGGPRRNKNIICISKSK